MTDVTMNLRALLEKSSDADMLREMIRRCGLLLQNIVSGLGSADHLRVGPRRSSITFF